jgi:hypothetical protein
MNKIVVITSRNFKYTNTYGGNICFSDFRTDYDGTRNIAERIMTDLKFDRQCAKNIASRARCY